MIKDYISHRIFPLPGLFKDKFDSSVQLLSCVWLFATPWTAARQASLSITNSRSLLKLMSIESVMPSNHFILCHPLLLLLSVFPSIRVFSTELEMPPNHPILYCPHLLLSSVFPSIRSFPVSHLLASGGQSIGVSASASVLPMNIQDWFPLGLTGFICLQNKGLSRVFSNITVQKHQFFGTQLSL